MTKSPNKDKGRQINMKSKAMIIKPVIRAAAAEASSSAHKMEKESSIDDCQGTGLCVPKTIFMTCMKLSVVEFSILCFQIELILSPSTH